MTENIPSPSETSVSDDAFAKLPQRITSWGIRSGQRVAAERVRNYRREVAGTYTRDQNRTQWDRDGAERCSNE